MGAPRTPGRPRRPAAPPAREMPVSATHHHKYARLSRGPYYEPVVRTARAYLATAIADPRAGEGVHWALSCLPGTTPWRLAAVTMRITDMLVVNRPRPGQTGVQAQVLLQRSTLHSGFGGPHAARDALAGNAPGGDAMAGGALDGDTPAGGALDGDALGGGLRLTDSDYYDAGPDQALLEGPWQDMIAALAHPVVADAARHLAAHLMAGRRTLHWRGHNRLLAADALDPA
jgi:hypothetical protein